MRSTSVFMIIAESVFQGSCEASFKYLEATSPLVYSGMFCTNGIEATH